jgi:hypothetical protein
MTTDHKRIGIMFLAATFLAMLLGGVVALILRIEHLTPHRTVVDAMTYNRLFTLHGVIMVWLFMIPAIPAGLGNFLLPLMLGAKDVAFPRLNLLSFYVYLLGAGITLSAMLMGGTDTGWTFYTPYSATSPTAVAPVVTGVFVLGISSIMSGINFIVTTHALRPRGMGWFDMPLFVWGIYATSIIQVLATPVLGLSLALVFLDHCFSWGIFDPARGGDPVLFEHLFWFYSHPAVYIMILPGDGHHQRGGLHLQPQESAVLQGHRLFLARHRPGRIPHLGPSSLRRRAVRLRLGSLRHHLRAGRGLLGDQGGHLAGHHVPRIDRLHHADGVRLHLPVPLRLRRHDRGGPGGDVAGCPLARHLFHRRAFPFHHGGRHPHRADRRSALLAAEDHRPPARTNAWV